MTLADDIVAGVLRRKKHEPAIAAFLPFIRPATPHRTMYAAELAIMAATFKGSFEATHHRLVDKAHAYFPGWTGATANALRNHIDHLTSLADERRRGYDEMGMNNTIDHVLESLTQAAVRTHALVPERSICVMDGKPLPFYGRSYTYGSARRRHLDEMTPAAQRAVPAFRGHKRTEGTIPQFAGAMNSIDWLNVTRYDPITQYNGAEMFRRLAHGRALESLVAESLGRLEQRPPWILMADKEFKGEAMTQLLLAFHKKTKAHVMVAMAIGTKSKLADELREMWPDPSRVHVIEGAEGGYAFWGRLEARWASGNSSYPLLALFRTAPPKDEAFAPSRLGIHLDVDGKLVPVYVYTFLCTFDEEFIRANAHFVERVFSRRWSGENVNKKTARHAPHSPSRRFLPRHLSYALGLIIQDLWHLWRCNEERVQPKRRWHPSRTLALYRGALRDALLPYALKPAKVTS